MSEIRTGAVTFKGDPVDLRGPQLSSGDRAPEFTAQAGDLSDHTLASTEGKVRIYNVLPSLDTPVCHAQTKRFNTEAANLPDIVEVITVSMDLPFAQGRWCAAEGVDRLTSVSDHRDASFTTAFGTLITGGALDRISARAVFVVDRAGVITHAEYVSEIAEHPDYDAVLAAAKTAAG